MRLRLDLPAEAVEVAMSDRFDIALPNEPWLRIEIDPLSIAPDDRQCWLRLLLERGVAGGHEVRVLGSTTATTDRGWPVEIVDTFVVHRGEVIEHRLVAIYDMLGHVGVVTAYATHGRRYAEELESLLLPLVASARPDWRSRAPVALSELWSLEVTPPSG